MYDCDAPATATKHALEINNIIDDLSKNPFVYAVRNNTSLLKYGLNVRRVNYKRMAIIYTIPGDVVYIHRILAQSMITGLN